MSKSQISPPRRALVMAAALLVAALACNLPTQTTQTPQPPPTEPPLPPAETPTQPVLPASPAAPTVAPPSETPTPAPPEALAEGGGVACYFGPGTEYSIDGGLLEGERSPVLGVDESGEWLQVENPRRPGKRCWVRLADVTVEGDLSLAVVVAAPKSIVTAVEVVLDPPVIQLNPCVFPVTFDVRFTITTTGPTMVTFQRSLSSGQSAPPETVEFDKAETKEFLDYYRVGSEGEHWFQVHVTSPNEVTAKGFGEVVCP